MSDFGALITIRKKENDLFSAKEIEKISEITSEIKQQIDLKDSLGKAYLFQVGKTISIDQKNECRALNILLSSYSGTSNDFQWHSEVDTKNMKNIVSIFQQKLALNYIVEAKFEMW